MLTKQENRSNFLLVRFLSLVNFLPIEIDLKTGKLSRQSGEWRFQLWNFIFIISNIHWFYVVLRFIESYTQSKKLSEFHLPLHLAFIATLTLNRSVGYKLFVRNLDATVANFNDVFVDEMTSLEGEEADQDEENPEKVAQKPPQPEAEGRPWTEYSRQEVVLWTLAYTVIGGCLLPSMQGLSVDPTRPQLIYTLLPLTHQNEEMFWFLWVIESALFALSLGLWFFFALLCSLFYLKCNLVCEQLQTRLSSCDQAPSCGDIMKMMKIIRLRVVYTKLINKCCADVIFVHKLCNLTVGIICGFSAIRHFSTNLALAVSNMILALSYILYFSIIFEKAYSIKDKLRDAKDQFLVVISKVESPGVKAFFVREVKGIPDEAIKVSDFRNLERESTLIFNQFIVEQVASLLLTFGQKH